MIKKRQAKHVRSYLETSLLKRRRRRKRILARVGRLMMLVVFVAGLIYLSKIKSMQVEAVEVKGTAQVSSSEIQIQVMDWIVTSKHLLGIVPSTNTFFVDEEVLEKKLLDLFPAIRTVAVRTSLGGTVTVSVAEREAVAIWCNDDSSQCYQMDETGYLFMEYSKEYSRLSTASSLSSASTSTSGASPSMDDLLILKGVIGENVGGGAGGTPIGQKFLSEKEIKAFEEVRGLLAKSEKSIDYVRCDSSVLCVIKISKNGVLKINPQEDLATAFDRLEAALTSPVFVKSNFEYIDLRFGNKLFYKLTNGLTNNDSQQNATSQQPVLRSNTESNQAPNPDSDDNIDSVSTSTGSVGR